MRRMLGGLLLGLMILTAALWREAVAGDEGHAGRAAASPAWFQPSQEVGPAWKDDAYRQFDFWIGTWDVDLRVQQDDASWEDNRSARANIYRILDGRAILELWDENVPGDGIRGYSLRFFDPEKKRWNLYLNWPRPNISGTNGLHGSFRHGRIEFFATRPGADGTETISRFTFSDIAPDRLRWDDAFSKDGGRTWQGNWIMEFTRVADRASWPEEGEPAHTFHTGERCDRSEFRTFDRLEGTFRGEIRLVDDSGTERTSVARMVGSRVLDGCAVMSFLEYVSGGRPRQIFSMKTFNTYVDLYEETSLDNQPGTPLHMLYGKDEDGTIRLSTRSGVYPPVRHTWTFPDPDTAALTIEKGAGGAAWRTLGTLELKRVK